MYGVDSSGSHQGELQPVACPQVGDRKKLKAGNQWAITGRGRLLLGFGDRHGADRICQMAEVEAG